MSVRQLLAETDSAELSEWLAFDQEYTLPDGHYVASTIAMAIYRAFAGAKVQPGDFAPIYAQPRREQAPEEAMALFRGITEANSRRLARG